MDNNDRFGYLVQQYSIRALSIPEQEELFEMIISNKYDASLSRIILKELQDSRSKEKADLPPHISEEIIRNIFKAEKNISAMLPVAKSPFHIWLLAASAACIAGLIFSISYFTTPIQKFNTAFFNALIPDSAVTKFNSTGQSQVVILSDSSKVTLQPQSSINYPKHFTADKREVYLKGEAFFQITKNPRRPFLVYYNNIITKVIGTSFNINTNPATGNVEVVVKTGKVQVYENEELLKRQEQNNAVIITPNQKAIYKEENRLFQTTLVETPLPIIANEVINTDSIPIKKEPFIYEQAKLSDIFQHLIKRYGIDIVVENDNINNCLFTGDISDNNLYNKLKIICLTTNASYEINGTTILVKGKGCN